MMIMGRMGMGPLGIEVTTRGGKSDKQLLAIKKQAESQADEYLRLMTENKSLRNQLEDYDMLMGGSRKKAA